MRVLVIGGAGCVGGLTLPFLRRHHSLRVLDRQRPAHLDAEFIAGSCLCEETLKLACAGMEGMVYMPLGRDVGGSIDAVHSAYDVNVKGLHLALQAGQAAGIRSAVYTSSLNIYADFRAAYLSSEAGCPTDTGEVYGFTKWLGEEVCRMFAEQRGLRVTALRLCGPVSEAEWQRRAREPGSPVHTAAADVADALHRALERRSHGYAVYFISGDAREEKMSLRRAREELGWQPRALPGFPWPRWWPFRG